MLTWSEDGLTWQGSCSGLRLGKCLVPLESYVLLHDTVRGCVLECGVCTTAILWG